MASMEYNGIKISVIHHASIIIEYQDMVIAIDPWKISSNEYKGKANVILITHEHYDHCSIEDIQYLETQNTKILAPISCLSKLNNKVKGEIIIIAPEQKVQIGNTIVYSVHSYNINKPFHQKGDGVGYIIDINGTRIYIAGDTDLIPEMQRIHAEIALLPVGGTYTMNSEEAAKAVKLISPNIAIPIHYGMIVGSDNDANDFCNRVKELGIECKKLI